MSNIEGLAEFNAKDIYFDNDQHEAGSGGFGQVWYGYHRVLKKYVAVKIFHVTGGPQEKAFVENTIKEEMSHLKKLNHNNIVRVLGWVKLDFAMGIVMEYCKNGNLRVLLLDKRIPLSVVLRVWLLSNIAKALACCHRFLDKRLVHGDVKPENFLLTGLLICKLCDFGTAELATLTSSINVTTPEKSKKKKIQYTPYYTAPEKLKDLAMKPTKELDIYSFAILLHMVLTRENPYTCGSDDHAALLNEIREGLRPNCDAIAHWKASLDDRDQAIVEKLEEIMKQCWDQNPSSRPTMTEVCDRLEELLDEQLSAVVEQHASDVLKKMDEIYPPANLKPCIPLNVMWARKNFPPEPKTHGQPADRFFALGDPTSYSDVTFEQTARKETLVKEFRASPKVGPDVIRYIRKSKSGFDELHNDLQGVSVLEVVERSNEISLCFLPVTENLEENLKYNQEEYENICTSIMNEFFSRFSTESVTYGSENLTRIRTAFKWHEEHEYVKIDAGNDKPINIYLRLIRNNEGAINVTGVTSDVNDVLQFIDENFNVKELSLEYSLEMIWAIRECYLIPKVIADMEKNVEIKIGENEEKNGTITLTGLRQHVQEARTNIECAVQTFQTRPVSEMGLRKRFLLATLHPEGGFRTRKEIQSFFSKRGINASLQLKSDDVCIVFCDPAEIEKAQKVLIDIVQQETLEVANIQEVVKTEQWKRLKSQIIASTIDVVGVSKDFKLALNEIGLHIAENLVITASFHAKSFVIEYLEKYLHLHKDSEKKLDGCQLEFKPTVPIIFLKGDSARVLRACSWLEEIIAGLRTTEKSLKGSKIVQYLHSPEGRNEIDLIAEKNRCVADIYLPQQKLPSSRLELLSHAFNFTSEDISPTVLGKTALKSFNITLMHGDITFTDCEAIVNSVFQFSFNGFLGKALIAKAGQAIVDECHHNPIFQSDNLRITSGGKLCKYILHLEIPTNIILLKNIIVECLVEADRLLGVKSLAIPAVGTGIMKTPIEFVAKSVAAALDEFDKMNPVNLKLVEVYVFESHMVPDFQRNLLKDTSLSDADTDTVQITFCSWESEDVDQAFQDVQKLKDDMTQSKANKLSYLLRNLPKP